jgi:hypothetical protein
MENTLLSKPQSAVCESAIGYAKGFLGGDAGIIFNESPRLLAGDRAVAERFLSLLWLRKLAYPSSSWAWAQFLPGEINRASSGVILTGTIPDVRVHLDALTASRCVNEWLLHENLARGTVVPPRVAVERAIPLDSAGRFIPSSGDLEKAEQQVAKDLLDGLAWLEKNNKRPPNSVLDRIAAAAAELRVSGTVVVPEEVRKALMRFVAKTPR